jgi:hypothetical protein
MYNTQHTNTMNSVPYLSLPEFGSNRQLKHATFPNVSRTTLLIDSRDRNYTTHPSSTNFVVDLPEPLRNVSSAMLISAEIPQSHYVFSAARGNTSLTVTVDATTYTVTIPDGNYTTTTMAAALKTALDTAFSATFTVTISATTMKCTIATTGTVSVDATAVERYWLGYYLGFPWGVVTSGSGSATGTQVVSMNPEGYLTIDIWELNGIVATGTGRRTFAKVVLQNDSYDYTTYDSNMTSVEVRPPRAHLDKLTVSLRYHDGTLVDLNGAEWSMTIECACTRASAT